MASITLDMTGGNSFYDIPKINPTGSDTEPTGPVKDKPTREVSTQHDYTSMYQMVPAVPKVTDAPENDPRKWNCGGNGNWWSMFEELGTHGKKPING